jgi:hypothetical protein
MLNLPRPIKQPLIVAYNLLGTVKTPANCISIEFLETHLLTVLMSIYAGLIRTSKRFATAFIQTTQYILLFVHGTDYFFIQSTLNRFISITLLLLMQFRSTLLLIFHCNLFMFNLHLLDTLLGHCKYFCSSLINKPNHYLWISSVVLNIHSVINCLNSNYANFYSLRVVQ